MVTPQVTATSHSYPKRPERRALSFVFSLIGLVLIAGCTVAAVTVPVPYVITTPGPTLDLNSPLEGEDIISIAGTDPNRGTPVMLDPSHDGQLRMVTISEYGGPGHSVSLLDLFLLTRDGVSEVENYYDIYGDEVTADEVQSYSQALMTSSHSTSTVAALEAIGWEVPAVVTVTGAVPESDAVGKVQQGDVLISATTPDNRVHPIDRAGSIFALMATQPADTTIKLLVMRDGVETPLDITSRPSPDGVGSKLGVFLDIKTTPPVEVDFKVEHIGGPSAGMMFALAIIDKLTPGDLTGGHAVAGTGAISYDGRIEPIGGLPQKIVGAKNDGAEYFLAPTANCDELTSIPDGINVYRVGTLDQALHALEAIAAGKPDTLPSCLAQ